MAAENDLESGTIYVLRSLSDDPRIAEYRELIHKIGVTGGSVEARIAGTKSDATYLLAEAEVVLRVIFDQFTAETAEIRHFR